MFSRNISRRFRLKAWAGLAVALLPGLTFSSCATIEPGETAGTAKLQQTASLIDDVKSFGKTLGIEPTATLSRTTQEAPALSMLWFWMQRHGTLALHAPIDIRMAIGFNTDKERLKIDQVYRVDGYSVYYRQGNEFADSRSVATVGFAAEPIVRRVMVILHEDLHGDANFALPWEIEEGIVTPLGSLAAAAYFRQKGDDFNWKNALASLREERRFSRELNALAGEAERLFALYPLDQAEQMILAQLSNYPTYRRQFERQIQGQHPATVLEAKLSHDLAYYRFFDRVATLAELAPNLKTLIEDLKSLPGDATATTTDKFLQELNVKYGSAAN